MEEEQKYKIKRPKSQNQLITFHKDSEYIMDNPNEYLKDSQRNIKFSIKELHEKWKRKVNVNFKNIDKKFDNKKSQPMKRVKTEQDEIQDKKFFDLLHGIYYDKSTKRDNNIKQIKQNFYDKYNDKKSYYLNNHNPWNNNSVFDIKDKKNNEKKILKNIIITKKKNNLINSKNKNYKSLNDRYFHDKYLITEVKNKFIKDKKEEIYNNLIYKNPELKKYPEKINAILFKEMIKLFNEYTKLIENKNNNFKLLSKHNFKDEEIFDKLQILLAYLKEHKEEINQQKFLEPLISDYNKILEKEEYLKKLDIKHNESIELKNKKKEVLNGRKSNKFDIFKYPIKQKMKEYRMNTFRTSNKEESKDIILNKNKEINYFLTAYKSVLKEKEEIEEKVEKLKKEKNISYIINEKSENPYGSFIKNEENNKETNIKNKMKRPNSSYGTRQINITYYHPGKYISFEGEDSDFNAWSCCLNEDKFSKGCCKKSERVLNFLYKY